MKNTGAIFLILAGLTGLFLYNTGRMEAILGIIRDPSYGKKPTGGGGALPGNNIGGGGGGGVGNCANDLLCFDNCAPNDTQCIAACVTSMGCLSDIFGGDGGDDIFDAIKNIGSIFTAPFGIRL